MEFSDGQAEAYYKNDAEDAYYVRCVRGGPFWPIDPSERLMAVRKYRLG